MSGNNGENITAAGAPSVCILMCTYNGARFIREQLDSLKAQQGVNIQYLVHDDGSSDDTVQILAEYGIQPVPGMAEHLGPARGFLTLMSMAPDADYYAFCDQDDVWDSDKLITAIKMLGEAASESPAADASDRQSEPAHLNRKSETIEQTGQESELMRDYTLTPALYCCSQRLVDADRNFMHTHVIDNRRSLNSRLFYASISGNTVVFNRRLREIACRHLPERLIMHDSWMVKICLCMSGRLVIDEEPHIDYRMHGSNEFGMELNLRQKLRKFKRILDDRIECRELLDIAAMYPDDITANASAVADGLRPIVNDKEYCICNNCNSGAAAPGKGDKDYSTGAGLGARLRFLKECGADFRNKGFNIAFALKIILGKI